MLFDKFANSGIFVKWYLNFYSNPRILGPLNPLGDNSPETISLINGEVLFGEFLPAAIAAFAAPRLPCPDSR